MRLINTESLSLHEFFDANIPKSYAILSHTWGGEEISFQEWRILEANRQPTSDNPPLIEFSTRNEAWIQRMEKKAGYKKIIDFCGLCRQHGYKWAWVDTCCIDKSSSAELSEAINSMYKWYKKSESCYAYLTDVSDSNHEINELPVEDGSRPSFRSSHRPLYDKPIDSESYARIGFASSQWFKRGWTLQELLAPPKVCFYDRDWKMIGTRYQLASLITNITKIPTSVVAYSSQVNYDERLVAERFFWVSNRKTSRAEDIAYCLLGLFDINMPLLYGEGGQNAFRRLQEEIIKKSTDHSIFIWFNDDIEKLRRALLALGPNVLSSGVLASSPRKFERCVDLICGKQQSQNMRDSKAIKKSYTLTNNGLHIELPLLDIPCPRCEKCQVALLDCWTLSKPTKRIGIYLQPCETGQFKRMHYDDIATETNIAAAGNTPTLQQIYILA